MEDDNAFFCFDSSAPDALKGDDLHRKEMHCDKLTKSTIQACAGNAVHGLQTADTRLYSAETPPAQSSTNQLAWAAAALTSFFALGVAVIRVLRVQNVSVQGTELTAQRDETISAVE